MTKKSTAPKSCALKFTLTVVVESEHAARAQKLIKAWIKDDIQHWKDISSSILEGSIESDKKP